MEDLVPILTKFHREIVVPDMERIAAASERRLRDEMHSLFDSLSRQIVEGLQEQVRTLEARFED